MNKKGATMIFFGMMLSVMIWIAFTQTLDPVKDETADARSVSKLDCANTSISTGVKATCVIVDWTLFGYAGAIISLIIGTAAGRLLDVSMRKKE